MKNITLKNKIKIETNHNSEIYYFITFFLLSNKYNLTNYQKIYIIKVHYKLSRKY